MVGRLVHHQHVGARQHQLSEQHAASFTSGKDAERLGDVVAGEKKLAQNAPYRLVVIAFEGPLLHPVEYLDVAFEYRRLVLRVIADRRLFRPLDRSLVRREFAEERSEQRRLAGPVGADDRQALPRLEQQGQIREQWLFEALADLVDLHRGPIQLALRIDLEADVRVLPARWLDVLDL